MGTRVATRSTSRIRLGSARVRTEMEIRFPTKNALSPVTNQAWKTGRGTSSGRESLESCAGLLAGR